MDILDFFIQLKETLLPTHPIPIPTLASAPPSSIGSRKRWGGAVGRCGGVWSRQGLLAVIVSRAAHQTDAV